jgi:hypothetical protein
MVTKLMVTSARQSFLPRQAHLKVVNLYPSGLQAPIGITCITMTSGLMENLRLLIAFLPVTVSVVGLFPLDIISVCTRPGQHAG